MLHLGDCIEVMRTLAPNSVDAIVTDPPYGLSFMNKHWDHQVPSIETWQEALRVLKPGGHLLSFGGTRTYHRLAVAIEDAGFEIRDQVQWLYGQGFPKSLDISKAIDKAAGAERKVVGQYISPEGTTGLNSRDDGYGFGMGDMTKRSITAPSTDAAKQWQGWGTALKPANEPIVLARRPLEKGLTVAQNVQKWGTGGINIDGCRIEGGPTHGSGKVASKSLYELGHKDAPRKGVPNIINTQGRFPANLLLDETAAQMLDEQTGLLKTGGDPRKTKQASTGLFGMGNTIPEGPGFAGDSGGASRFFKQFKQEYDAANTGMSGSIWTTPKFNYCAKTSTSERNAGLEEGKNSHPTVKPIKLMEYLCRLITPPGGVVLDPFMGSGSTGIAAKNLDLEFIGIELNSEYWEIATRRIGG